MDKGNRNWIFGVFCALLFLPMLEAFPSGSHDPARGAPPEPPGDQCEVAPQPDQFGLEETLEQGAGTLGGYLNYAHTPDRGAYGRMHRVCDLASFFESHSAAFPGYRLSLCGAGTIKTLCNRVGECGSASLDEAVADLLAWANPTKLDPVAGTNGACASPSSENVNEEFEGALWSTAKEQIERNFIADASRCLDLGRQARAAIDRTTRPFSGANVGNHSLETLSPLSDREREGLGRLVEEAQTKLDQRMEFQSWFSRFVSEWTLRPSTSRRNRTPSEQFEPPFLGAKGYVLENGLLGGLPDFVEKETIERGNKRYQVVTFDGKRYVFLQRRVGMSQDFYSSAPQWDPTGSVMQLVGAYPDTMSSSAAVETHYGQVELQDALAWQGLTETLLNLVPGGHTIDVGIRDGMASRDFWFSLLADAGSLVGGVGTLARVANGVRVARYSATVQRTAISASALAQIPDIAVVLNETIQAHRRGEPIGPNVALLGLRIFTTAFDFRTASRIRPDVPCGPGSSPRRNSGHRVPGDEPPVVRDPAASPDQPRIPPEPNAPLWSYVEENFGPRYQPDMDDAIPFRVADDGVPTYPREEGAVGSDNVTIMTPVRRGEIDRLREHFLGPDAVEVSPGKWRSRDGRRQFRQVANDDGGVGGRSSHPMRIDVSNTENRRLRPELEGAGVELNLNHIHMELIDVDGDGVAYVYHNLHLPIGD